MSRGGFAHFAVRKRTIRIGIFNIAAWVIGTLLGFVLLLLTNTLWALVSIPIGMLVGLPIPDIGSPHAWLLREWRSRHQWRQDHGVLLHAPIAQDQDDNPSKIGQVELVVARVDDKKGNATFLPLLTTTAREHVTMALNLGGASDLWLGGDGDVKFFWDLEWFDAMGRALSVSKDEILHFVMTRIHRPANMENGLAYNRSRGNERVLAAIASGGRDPQYNNVEVGIGKNLIDGFNNGYSVGGEPSNYCLVRMPWPTNKLGRKIDFKNADAFRKSSLFKTISKVLEAYRRMEVEADFVDLQTMRVMWEEFWHLLDLDTVRMYRKRDEELPATPRTADSPDPQLEKPISLRANKPGRSGYIDYGGSCHVVGYATEITRHELPPGFQEETVVLSDDTHYTLSTYVEAPLVKSEVRKTREKERILRSKHGSNPLTQGLSNPEEETERAEVRAHRRRLTEGSLRTGNFLILASVVGRSPDEAEARWDDMCAQLASTYTFVRVHHRDDMQDVLLGQLAVRVG